MMSAGPAPRRITSPFGPTCPAAAEPIEPKMPAPMTAPIASMIRSPAPNARFRLFGFPSSAMSAEIGLREKREFITRWVGGLVNSRLGGLEREGGLAAPDRPASPPTH